MAVKLNTEPLIHSFNVELRFCNYTTDNILKKFSFMELSLILILQALPTIKRNKIKHPNIRTENVLYTPFCTT